MIESDICTDNPHRCPSDQPLKTLILVRLGSNSTEGASFAKINNGYSCYLQTSRSSANSVDHSELAMLRKLREAHICPNCGSKIPAGTAMVHGPGSFCSLDCVALFSEAAFSERAKRLAAAARN
jgi:hypothetical protein